MQAGQFLHERESNAAAFVGTAVQAFDAMKTLENLGLFFFRDAETSIFDAKLEMIARIVEPNGDGSRQGKFEGVGNQVQDDLLPHVAVHVSRLWERRAIDDEGEASLVHGRAESARGVGSKGRKICGFVDGLHAPGFDPREI